MWAVCYLLNASRWYNAECCNIVFYSIENIMCLLVGYS